MGDYFGLFGMSGIMLTNISIIDILCFELPFIFRIVEFFFKNSLGDKTCNANFMVSENLLWRMISHFAKWDKGFSTLTIGENDAWVFVFLFLENELWHMILMKEKIFLFLSKFWKVSEKIAKRFHFIFLWRSKKDFLSHLYFCLAIRLFKPSPDKVNQREMQEIKTF